MIQQLTMFNSHKEHEEVIALESGKIAEANAINNSNAKDTQIRRDLKLTAPLPNSILLNENGITAIAAGDTKFARLDNRGLYVKGGAMFIDGDIDYILKKVEESEKAGAFTTNPHFTRWLSNDVGVLKYPNQWEEWITGSEPIRESGTVGFAARFNNTGTEQKGMTVKFNTVEPKVPYVFFEAQFNLLSGTLNGAGFLFRLIRGASTVVRDIHIPLKDVFPTVPLGKWKKFSQLIKIEVPDTDYDFIQVFMFGNYTHASYGGSGVKNIVYDECLVRPATAQEVKAHISITEGASYQGVTISADTGLVLEGDKNKVSLHQAKGLEIINKQSPETDKRVFYADTNGNLTLTGNINMNGGDIFWGLKDSVDKEKLKGLFYDSTTDTLAIRASHITVEGDGSNTETLEELFQKTINGWRAGDKTTIDGGKIETGTVSAEAIATEELFASNAFITSLRAKKIFVEQLTGGKISADMIDTKDLSVVDKDNNTSFHVDSNGNVVVRGDISSQKYSEVNGEEFGYSLSASGIATLNDCIVRGSVRLQNSGITDYGASSGRENILKNSNFSHTTPKTGFSLSMGAGQTGTFDVVEDDRFEKAAKVYKGAHVNYHVFATSNWDKAKFKVGKTYTVSFFAKKEKVLDSGNKEIPVKINVSIKEGNATNGIGTGKDFSMKDEWARVEYQFTYTGTPVFNLQQVYIVQDANSIVYYANFKVEESEKASRWNPHSAEKENNVRFWAGSSYKTRRDAPFRVLEDGSIFALKGYFGGTFTGSVDIGNIHISDTNDTKGFIRFQDANDVNTLIELTEDSSFYNTDFLLGTKTSPSFRFNKRDNNIFISTPLNIVNGANTVSFQNAGTNELVKLKKDNTEITMESVSGSMKFRHNNVKTTSEPHFEFINPSGNTEVKIVGSLVVSEEIRMKGRVRMISRNDGIDFVVS